MNLLKGVKEANLFIDLSLFRAFFVASSPLAAARRMKAPTNSILSLRGPKTPQRHISETTGQPRDTSEIRYVPFRYGKSIKPSCVDILQVVHRVHCFVEGLRQLPILYITIYSASRCSLQRR